MERVVLEDAQANAVAHRQAAVLAIVAVLDLVGVASEPVPVEGAIDDGRDPPTRDRVLPQLEQTCGHVRRPLQERVRGAIPPPR